MPVFGKSNLIYTLIRSDGVIRIPQDSNGVAQGSVGDGRAALIFCSYSSSYSYSY